MIALLFSVFTTTAIGLFSGAAFHIALAEQPARLALTNAAAAQEWRASFKRAFFMQGPLAVLSIVSGAATAFLTGRWSWLIPAGIMLAIVAFTVVALNPVNHALNADRDLDSPETIGLIERWGRLHVFRVPFAVVAMLVSIYLIAAL